MFNIRLIDVGGDGLTTAFDTVVETLAEAELLAGMECVKHIEQTNASLIHQHDLIYDVISNGHNVGMCVIKSI